MTIPNRQKALERLAARLAKRLADWLDGRPELYPDGRSQAAGRSDVLFAVLLFTAGPGGFAAYSSNAERLTMIRALKEMADTLARDPERDALYQIGSLVLDAAQGMDRKLRKRIKERERRWQIAMTSYKVAAERFDETAAKLAELDDNAEDTPENLRLAALTHTALISMASALVLACSYTPGIREIEAVDIRASDEVH